MPSPSSSINTLSPFTPIIRCTITVPLLSLRRSPMPSRMLFDLVLILLWLIPDGSIDEIFAMLVWVPWNVASIRYASRSESLSYTIKSPCFRMWPYCTSSSLLSSIHAALPSLSISLQIAVSPSASSWVGTPTKSVPLNGVLLNATVVVSADIAGMDTRSSIAANVSFSISFILSGPLLIYVSFWHL